MIFFRYLRFRLQAGDAHAIHSPFVFRLYTDVIKQWRPYSCYETIEDSRAELLASPETIEVTDFGAGSKRLRGSRRRVRDIARWSEKSPRLAQLLFRLVNHFQPNVIFDLGTSLGTTTLYMAHARQKSQLYSFEGDRNLAAIAQRRFDRFGLRNVVPVLGNIDEKLPETLPTVEKLDFVFFDANHRREPTLRYFAQCLEKAHPDSVFVFDDIYWSGEMQQAWQQIRMHPSVTLTIDLFFVGLVFFRNNQPKQHFRLRL
ncbi:MAG: class I SAM-dependent methyltransferase [Cytophagales bacterium]|jgi:predicted O-methyltransferase YrrM|nr:class I SAM-dependent methyltransferase [Cytophagales bacterium]